MFTCDQCGTQANLAPEDFPLHCVCGVRYEFGKSRGLGDTVAKITKAVGIKPCGGCAKRRKAMNKIFPFRGAQKSG